MDSIVSDALDEAEEQANQSGDSDVTARNERTETQSGGQEQSQSRNQSQTNRSQSDSTRSMNKSNRQNQSNSGNSTAGLSDDELADVVDDLSTSITVVGCGGGGCNTVTRMMEEGIEGCDMVAMNTDAQHLLETRADQKLLIGREKTDGRGAGSVPKVGEDSALENRDEILDIVSGEDMVFVTAGMGGGTGTGAAPIVAEAANETGALTISIVTLPFSSEGRVRRTNAESGLEKLRKVSDTVIVIPNDRLLDSVGEMPVTEAFKVCDEVLMRSVKGITEMITTSSLVNLDFADVKTIMENGGVAMIGLGESSTASRSSDVVDSAVSSPLLDVDISSANSVLVNVTGGPKMSIDEAEGVVENLHDRVDDDARIIWGTGVDEDLNDTIRALVVVTGVDSPQIYGQDDDPQSYYEQEDENDDLSDIDHVV